jgi:predicted pyridoxine 5'-phosphate oxidase superfamily flavin-nucleotide-binding protein
MSMDVLEKPLPWHQGELALQAMAGATSRMVEIGRRNVRDYLNEQHREFYPLLPFIVLGSVDADGRPWATLRAGIPGFVHAPDDAHLALEVRRDRNDPADAGMNDGDSIGLLGIELPTRRRNRMNGRIERTSSDCFAVAVEHAFGNCPKYIQQRYPAFIRDPKADVTALPETSEGLDDRARRMIANADSFFVASYVDDEVSHRQVDVSHRGGPRGFVRIGAGGVLTIPDFKGNKFFNTLGNLWLNPRAGLAFVDFSTGDMLQLTGRGEVVLDPGGAALMPGAERLWRFTAEASVFRRDALPLRFSFDDDGGSTNLKG